jgi:hypothetical protein
MATAAQLTANRANALHSTGPVTPDGKLRVAQNALKHGLTAKHLVVSSEDREEFESLREALIAELAPQGAIETITFNEILHAAWNLHRFRRIEARISCGDLDDFILRESTTVLDRLTRYQARAQRAYYRALQELRTLQTNRALRAIEIVSAGLSEVPALAAVHQLTKQTHSKALKQPLEPFSLQCAALSAPLNSSREGELASIGR